jgi:hypothetical protein
MASVAELAVKYNWSEGFAQEVKAFLRRLKRYDYADSVDVGPDGLEMSFRDGGEDYDLCWQDVYFKLGTNGVVDGTAYLNYRDEQYPRELDGVEEIFEALEPWFVAS